MQRTVRQPVAIGLLDSNTLIFILCHVSLLRDRWFNHLNPDIKKDAWTAEEDSIIVHAHMQMGNKWCAALVFQRIALLTFFPAAV